MPAAAIFDLDGTLIDGFEAIAASVNHVRAVRGLLPLPLDSVKRAVGHGLLRLLEKTVPEGDLEANAAEFNRHHPTVLASGTRPLPGVLETLQFLSRQGVRLGICSNKPLAITTALIATIGLAPFFEVVYGPERVARPKPFPDMLLAAMAELGVTAEEAIYVGDMTVDIECARTAGVRVCIIPTGSQDLAVLETANPDRMLRDFRELLDEFPEERHADLAVDSGFSAMVSG
jgi:2-phosphoglycolate phosphatase